MNHESILEYIDLFIYVFVCLFLFIYSFIIIVIIIVIIYLCYFINDSVFVYLFIIYWKPSLKSQNSLKRQSASQESQHTCPAGKVWDCCYVASPSFQWYFPAHLLLHTVTKSRDHLSIQSSFLCPWHHPQVSLGSWSTKLSKHPIATDPSNVEIILCDLAICIGIGSRNHLLQGLHR